MTSHPLCSTLQNHTCLYASFNQSINADVCRGDGRATMNADFVRLEPSGGRFHGGALAFDAKDNGWAEDEFTFPARDNFPFQQSPFAGTISLWLKGDPDADLSPDFPVDPFHVSRHPADGSYYLDLTRPNDWRYGSPRKLRLGIYGDSPQQDMFVGGQLIVVSDLNFDDRRWHHIAATWRNANSGYKDGAAALYIDGKLRGSMDGYAHQLSWNLDELTIGLGQRYVGMIDELLILDAVITPEEAAQLHEVEAPLAELY